MTGSIIKLRLVASSVGLIALISVDAGIGVSSAGAQGLDRYGDPLPSGAVLRLGTIRFRVEAYVSSVAVSRDSKWVAAGDSAGLVYLWEASSGRIVRQMQMQQRWPKVFFSHDCQILGARDGDGHVSLWCIGTGKVLAAFDRGSKDNYRRSEQPLPTAGGKELITVPDLNDLVAVRNGIHAQAYVIGEVLHEGSIEVLEWPGGKRLRRLTRNEPQTIFAGVALSPDGRQLAVAMRHITRPRKLLRLVDTATAKVIREIRGDGEGWFLSVAFAADGKTVALGSKDEILLADTATGVVTARLAAKMKTVAFVAFAPDARTLVSHSHDNKVRVWRLTDRSIVREFGAEATGHDVSPLPTGLREPAHDEHFNQTYCTALSADGKTLVVGTSCWVQLLDVATGTQRFPTYAPDDGWSRVSYSANGQLLLLNCAGTLRLWDANRGVVRKEIPKRIGYAMLSPDGQTLALTPHFREQKPGAPAVVLWDLASGKEKRRLEHPPAEQFGFVNVMFAPDGGSLWTLAVHRVNAGYVDATMIRRWDASTGELLRSIDRQDTYAHSGVISPDGRTAAVPLMDDLLLVDIESDRNLGTLPDLVPGGRPWHAVFSSDSGFLIAGSLDGEIGFAEIATRSVVTRISLKRTGNRKLAQWPLRKRNAKGDFEREPPLDQPTLEALAVSRDGRLVATSEAFDWRHSAPKFSEIPPPQIRVWEATTGKEVQRFAGFRSRCTSVCFSPDGRRLASAFHNGTALVWEINPIVTPAPQKLTEMSLQRLWKELASTDAARAHEVMALLLSAPEQAVPMFRQHLHPVSTEKIQQVRRLLRGINSDIFKEREHSARELTDRRAPYRPLLQQALREATTLEMKRRLEIILAGDARRLPPELARMLRSIQTLERIGSVEARRVLTDLAKGATGALQTQAAREALLRLELRQ
jgi:WD40 repeat protein